MMANTREREREPDVLTSPRPLLPLEPRLLSIANEFPSPDLPCGGRRSRGADKNLVKLEKQLRALSHRMLSQRLCYWGRANIGTAACGLLLFFGLIVLEGWLL